MSRGGKVCLGEGTNTTLLHRQPHVSSSCYLPLSLYTYIYIQIYVSISLSLSEYTYIHTYTPIYIHIHVCILLQSCYCCLHVYCYCNLNTCCNPTVRQSPVNIIDLCLLAVARPLPSVYANRSRIAWPPLSSSPTPSHAGIVYEPNKQQALCMYLSMFLPQNFCIRPEPERTTTASLNAQGST